MTDLGRAPRYIIPLRTFESQSSSTRSTKLVEERKVLGEGALTPLIAPGSRPSHLKPFVYAYNDRIYWLMVSGAHLTVLDESLCVVTVLDPFAKLSAFQTIDPTLTYTHEISAIAVSSRRQRVAVGFGANIYIFRISHIFHTSKRNASSSSSPSSSSLSSSMSSVGKSGFSKGTQPTDVTTEDGAASMLAFTLELIACTAIPYPNTMIEDASPGSPLPSSSSDDAVTGTIVASTRDHILELHWTDRQSSPYSAPLPPAPASRRPSRTSGTSFSKGQSGGSTAPSPPPPQQAPLPPRVAEVIVITKTHIFSVAVSSVPINHLSVLPTPSLSLISSSSSSPVAPAPRFEYLTPRWVACAHIDLFSSPAAYKGLLTALSPRGEWLALSLAGSSVPVVHRLPSEATVIAAAAAAATAMIGPSHAGWQSSAFNNASSPPAATVTDAYFAATSGSSSSSSSSFLALPSSSSLPEAPPAQSLALPFVSLPQPPVLAAVAYSLAHSLPVTQLSFNPKPREGHDVLLTLSEDGHVRLWRHVLDPAVVNPALATSITSMTYGSNVAHLALPSPTYMSLGTSTGTGPQQQQPQIVAGGSLPPLGPSSQSRQQQQQQQQAMHSIHRSSSHQSFLVSPSSSSTALPTASYVPGQPPHPEQSPPVLTGTPRFDFSSTSNMSRSHSQGQTSFGPSSSSSSSTSLSSSHNYNTLPADMFTAYRSPFLPSLAHLPEDSTLPGPSGYVAPSSAGSSRSASSPFTSSASTSSSSSSSSSGSMAGDAVVTLPRPCPSPLIHPHTHTYVPAPLPSSSPLAGVKGLGMLPFLPSSKHVHVQAPRSGYGPASSSSQFQSQSQSRTVTEAPASYGGFAESTSTVTYPCPYRFSDSPASASKKQAVEETPASTYPAFLPRLGGGAALGAGAAYYSRAAAGGNAAAVAANNAMEVAMTWFVASEMRAVKGVMDMEIRNIKVVQQQMNQQAHPSSASSASSSASLSSTSSLSYPYPTPALAEILAGPKASVIDSDVSVPAVASVTGQSGPVAVTLPSVRFTSCSWVNVGSHGRGGYGGGLEDDEAVDAGDRESGVDTTLAATATGATAGAAGAAAAVRSPARRSSRDATSSSSTAQGVFAADDDMKLVVGDHSMNVSSKIVESAATVRQARLQQGGSHKHECCRIITTDTKGSITCWLVKNLFHVPVLTPAAEALFTMGRSHLVAAPARLYAAAYDLPRPADVATGPPPQFLVELLIASPGGALHRFVCKRYPESRAWRADGQLMYSVGGHQLVPSSSVDDSDVDVDDDPLFEQCAADAKRAKESTPLSSSTAPSSSASASSSSAQDPPIRGLVTHPSQSHAASIGADGQIAVWSLLASETVPDLAPVANIHLHSQVLPHRVVPVPNHLALYRKRLAALSTPTAGSSPSTSSSKVTYTTPSMRSQAAWQWPSACPRYFTIAWIPHADATSMTLCALGFGPVKPPRTLTAAQHVSGRCMLDGVTAGATGGVASASVTGSAEFGSAAHEPVRGPVGWVLDFFTFSTASLLPSWTLTSRIVLPPSAVSCETLSSATPLFLTVLRDPLASVGVSASTSTGGVDGDLEGVSERIGDGGLMQATAAGGSAAASTASASLSSSAAAMSGAAPRGAVTWTAGLRSLVAVGLSHQILLYSIDNAFDRGSISSESLVDILFQRRPGVFEWETPESLSAGAIPAFATSQPSGSSSSSSSSTSPSALASSSPFGPFSSGRVAVLSVDEDVPADVDEAADVYNDALFDQDLMTWTSDWTAAWLIQQVKAPATTTLTCGTTLHPTALSPAFSLGTLSSSSLSSSSSSSLSTSSSSSSASSTSLSTAGGSPGDAGLDVVAALCGINTGDPLVNTTAAVTFSGVYAIVGTSNGTLVVLELPLSVTQGPLVLANFRASARPLRQVHCLALSIVATLDTSAVMSIFECASHGSMYRKECSIQLYPPVAPRAPATCFSGKQQRQKTVVAETSSSSVATMSRPQPGLASTPSARSGEYCLSVTDDSAEVKDVWMTIFDCGDGTLRMLTSSSRPGHVDIYVPTPRASLLASPASPASAVADAAGPTPLPTPVPSHVNPFARPMATGAGSSAAFVAMPTPSPSLPSSTSTSSSSTTSGLPPWTLAASVTLAPAGFRVGFVTQAWPSHLIALFVPAAPSVPPPPVPAAALTLKAGELASFPTGQLSTSVIPPSQSTSRPSLLAMRVFPAAAMTTSLSIDGLTATASSAASNAGGTATGTALPPYHPLLLMEDVRCGRLVRARNVIAHLHRELVLISGGTSELLKPPASTGGSSGATEGRTDANEPASGKAKSSFNFTFKFKFTGVNDDDSAATNAASPDSTANVEEDDEIARVLRGTDLPSLAGARKKAGAVVPHDPTRLAPAVVRRMNKPQALHAPALETLVSPAEPVPAVQLDDLKTYFRSAKARDQMIREREMLLKEAARRKTERHARRKAKKGGAGSGSASAPAVAATKSAQPKVRSMLDDNSSDDDATPAPKPAAPSIKPAAPKVRSMLDSDSDSDPSPPPKPTPKPAPKPASKVKSMLDSDSDSDPAPAPAPKPTPKPAPKPTAPKVKSMLDSDSDSDPSPPPAKPIAPPTKPSAPKVKSMLDSDSDSDVTPVSKPAPKPTPAPAPKQKVKSMLDSGSDTDDQPPASAGPSTQAPSSSSSSSTPADPAESSSDSELDPSLRAPIPDVAPPPTCAPVVSRGVIELPLSTQHGQELFTLLQGKPLTVLYEEQAAAANAAAAGDASVGSLSHAAAARARLAASQRQSSQAAAAADPLSNKGMSSSISSASSSSSTSASSPSSSEPVVLLPGLSPAQVWALGVMVRSVSSVDPADRSFDDLGRRYIVAARAFSLAKEESIVQKVDTGLSSTAAYAAAAAQAATSGPSTSQSRDDLISSESVPLLGVVHGLHSSTKEALLQATLGQAYKNGIELALKGNPLAAVSAGQGDDEGAASAGAGLEGMAKGPEILSWPVMRAFGAGYLLLNSSYTELKSWMEKLAHVQYQKTRSANDCLLWYLALGKRDVLLGLLKDNPSMHKAYQFFNNDFSKPAWKEKALANAFSALSKRRLHVATAFFLLAGSLDRACRVCFRNDNDWQLALLLAKLVEGDNSPTYRSILSEELLPAAEASDDPWLRHIGLVLLKRSDALRSLFKRPDAAQGDLEEGEVEKAGGVGVGAGVGAGSGSKSTGSMLVKPSPPSDSTVAASSGGDRPLLSLSSFHPAVTSLVLALDSSKDPAHALYRESPEVILTLSRASAMEYLRAGCPLLGADILQEVACGLSAQTAAMRRAEADIKAVSLDYNSDNDDDDDESGSGRRGGAGNDDDDDDDWFNNIGSSDAGGNKSAGDNAATSMVAQGLWPTGSSSSSSSSSSSRATGSKSGAGLASAGSIARDRLATCVYATLLTRCCYAMVARSCLYSQQPTVNPEVADLDPASFAAQSPIGRLLCGTLDSTVCSDAATLTRRFHVAPLSLLSGASVFLSTHAMLSALVGLHSRLASDAATLLSAGGKGLQLARFSQSQPQNGTNPASSSASMPSNAGGAGGERNTLVLAASLASAYSSSPSQPSSSLSSSSSSSSSSSTAFASSTGLRIPVPQHLGLPRLHHVLCQEIDALSVVVRTRDLRQLFRHPLIWEQVARVASDCGVWHAQLTLTHSAQRARDVTALTQQSDNGGAGLPKSEDYLPAKPIPVLTSSSNSSNSSNPTAQSPGAPPSPITPEAAVIAALDRMQPAARPLLPALLALTEVASFLWALASGRMSAIRRLIEAPEPALFLSLGLPTMEEALALSQSSRAADAAAVSGAAGAHPLGTGFAVAALMAKGIPFPEALEQVLGANKAANRKPQSVVSTLSSAGITFSFNEEELPSLAGGATLKSRGRRNPITSGPMLALTLQWHALAQQVFVLSALRELDRKMHLSFMGSNGMYSARRLVSPQLMPEAAAICGVDMLRNLRDRTNRTVAALVRGLRYGSDRLAAATQARFVKLTEFTWKQKMYYEAPLAIAGSTATATATATGAATGDALASTAMVTSSKDRDSDDEEEDTSARPYPLYNVLLPLIQCPITSPDSLPLWVGWDLERRLVSAAAELMLALGARPLDLPGFLLLPGVVAPPDAKHPWPSNTRRGGARRSGALESSSSSSYAQGGSSKRGSSGKPKDSALVRSATSATAKAAARIAASYAVITTRRFALVDLADSATLAAAGSTLARLPSASMATFSLTLHPPVAVFRAADKHDVPHVVAINNHDPRFAVIGTAGGLHEINLSGVLALRAMFGRGALQDPVLAHLFGQEPVSAGNGSTGGSDARGGRSVGGNGSGSSSSAALGGARLRGPNLPSTAPCAAFDGVGGDLVFAEADEAVWLQALLRVVDREKVLGAQARMHVTTQGMVFRPPRASMERVLAMDHPASLGPVPRALAAQYTHTVASNSLVDPITGNSRPVFYYGGCCATLLHSFVSSSSLPRPYPDFALPAFTRMQVEAASAAGTLAYSSASKGYSASSGSSASSALSYSGSGPSSSGPTGLAGALASVRDQVVKATGGTVQQTTGQAVASLQNAMASSSAVAAAHAAVGITSSTSAGGGGASSASNSSVYSSASSSYAPSSSTSASSSGQSSSSGGIPSTLAWLQVAPYTQEYRNQTVTCVVSHPSLPFYVTANAKNQILLWHFFCPIPMAEFSFARRNTHLDAQFGFAPSLALSTAGVHSIAAMGGGTLSSYSSSAIHTAPLDAAFQGGVPAVDLSHDLVTRLVFDSVGSRLLAVTAKGIAAIWAFTPDPAPDLPLVGWSLPVVSALEVWICNNRRANDAVFLATSTMFATGGDSSDSRNVNIWDHIQPSRTRHVASFKLLSHEFPESAGCTALEYVRPANALLAGGARGIVYLIDLDTMMPRDRIDMASDAAITAITYAPKLDLVFVGDSMGNVRAAQQQVQGFQRVADWNQVCSSTAKATSSSGSAYGGKSSQPASGILALHASDDVVLMVGADGIVRMIGAAKDEGAALQLDADESID